MAGPPKAPSDANAEREAKLAQALRANLRRRKAADRPEPALPPKRPVDGDTGD